MQKEEVIQATPSRGWQISQIGPGLVFVLASVGPQDLVSNAVAGATYGYSMLWTVALVVLARYVFLDATARYVVVTGDTLMMGYARAGRWVVWVVFLSVFVKRHLSSLAHVLILGAAMDMLLPLPTAWGVSIWAGAFSLLGFALMYWGKYPLVEKISKPIVLLLGGSLVLAAVFSNPNWPAIGRGALVPTVPEGYSLYGFALVLMALMGAGAGSLANVKYAAFAHERGWRDISFLKQQRVDLICSGAGMYLMAVFIQIAAADTLRGAGGSLKEVRDLLPMLSNTLGNLGRIILGLGLWSKVFASYITANAGYGLVVSDIWYNVLGRPKSAGLATGEGNFSDRPVYRWCVIWFCLSPMYVLFTDWKPLWLALMAAALQVVLLPLIIGVLMWMTNDRKRMGQYANGWLVNSVMILMIGAASYLTYEAGVDLWRLAAKTLTKIG